MVKKIVFSAGTFCLFSFLVVFVYGEENQEKFPFTGEITTDNVNVRAGPNINFERLCRLNKGQKTIVVSKNYDWYKIKLPENAECYINERYIRSPFGDIGTITANRVNIRAGAGDKFSVIGQLFKGAKVKIKGKTQNWYQIESPEGSYGWIANQFVVFRFQEIPPIKIVIEPSRSIYKKNAAILQDNPHEKKQPELFSVIGRVEDLGRVVPSKDIRYKLLVNDKIIYYLEGDRDLLSGVVHYTVKVEGKIKPDPEKHYKYPVIVVSKINSML